MEIVPLYGIPSGLRPDSVVTRNDIAMTLEYIKSIVIASGAKWRFTPPRTTWQSLAYTGRDCPAVRDPFGLRQKTPRDDTNLILRPLHTIVNCHPFLSVREFIP
jgi:hypothetical protein